MLDIVPARRELRDVALALLQGPSGTGERRVAIPLATLYEGDVPLDDLLIAVENGRPVGAILAVCRPGEMAFLWPPATVVGCEQAEVADRLLQSMAVRLDAAGVHLTQCLLEPDDAAAREVLQAGGFPFVTDMLQLTLDLAPLPTEDILEFKSDSPTDELGLCATTYDNSNHAAFVNVIESTFQETLDCASLAQLRGGEETLAAHRGIGPFEPRLWQLFSLRNDAVGILLAVDHFDRRTREIAYLGVVPHARRRGIARAVLTSALRAARRDDCESIEVAVDANNERALPLYFGLGFCARRRMAVHLRLSRNGLLSTAADK